MVSSPRRSRISPAEDGGRRQRPEIPAVERVRWRAIHEEDFAGPEHAAALPIRRSTAETVAFERAAHGVAIDGDEESATADGLARKREVRFTSGTPSGR